MDLQSIFLQKPCRVVTECPTVSPTFVLSVFVLLFNSVSLVLMLLLLLRSRLIRKRLSVVAASHDTKLFCFHAQISTDKIISMMQY